jgi:[ribosomal protein S18]-alanine N-acetyltransferase
MTPFLVMPMAPEHIPIVAELEKICFGSHWTPTHFARELENPRCHYLVILKNDKPIGYIGFWQILEEAHITTIAIQPEFRKHYLAQHLLAQMLEDCLEKGVQWVTLEVSAANFPAQKLYEKFGFTVKGRRKNYYQAEKQDALIMWTENIGEENYLSLLQKLKAEIPVLH